MFSLWPDPSNSILSSFGVNHASIVLVVMVVLTICFRGVCGTEDDGAGPDAGDSGGGGDGGD